MGMVLKIGYHLFYAWPIFFVITSCMCKISSPILFEITQDINERISKFSAHITSTHFRTTEVGKECFYENSMHAIELLEATVGIGLSTCGKSSMPQNY